MSLLFSSRSSLVPGHTRLSFHLSLLFQMPRSKSVLLSLRVERLDSLLTSF